MIRGLIFISSILALVLSIPLLSNKTAPIPTEPGDVRIPDTLRDLGFNPIDSHFRYDIELARQIYRNPSLNFYNLDPTIAPSEEYVEALGIFLVHTTLELAFPAWSRKVGLSDDPVGNLKKYGILPTPYRYQMKATPVNAAPQSFALSEPIYTRDGESYISFNCFVCHAGIHGNNVIAGAPNKNIKLALLNKDVSTYITISKTLRDWFGTLGHKIITPPIVALLTGQFIEVSAESSKILATAEKLEHLGRLALNPDDNVPAGGNVGPFNTLVNWTSLKMNGENFEDTHPAIMKGKRSPALNRLVDIINTYLGGVVPPTASRPWWSGRYSGYHFRLAITPQGSEASSDELALFLQAPSIANSHYTVFDKRVKISKYIQTYIEQIESPPFPREINKELASKGFDEYQQHCQKCHGSFVKLSPDQYRLDYDLDKAKKTMKEMGVDSFYPEMYRQAGFVENILRSNKDLEGHDFVFRIPALTDELYIYAPPLVGIWAASPYLHNNSIPTLYHLLNPAVRPKFWKMSENPYAYDYTKVGVEFTPVSSTPKKYKNIEDFLFYNTEAIALSNKGHYVGRTLTDPERWAIIEFLKSVGTHNVIPNPLKEITHD